MQPFYCSSCGKQNPPDAKFCNHCAVAIAPPMQSTKEKGKKIKLSTILFVLAFLGLAYWFVSWAYRNNFGAMRNTVDDFAANTGISEPKNKPSSTSSTSSNSSSKSRKITKQELGSEYPFTVEEGFVSCADEPNAVLFVANAQIYAVNGTAKSLRNNSGEKRYKPIDEIWADDPNIKGAKINIGKVIEIGLEVCKKR